MDDLLREFIAETRETLDAVAGEIVAWEADPSDRARLDAIFRFVHTVKGSCGFLALPRLERLSHAAEEALASVRAGERQPDAALISAILAIIDRISDHAGAAERGETLEGDDEQLIAALAERRAASGPAGRAPAQRAPVRSIRVPVELLDRLMAGVSDVVLARNELARQLRRIPTGFETDAAFERVSGFIAEMREAITRTRMQRIEGLFSALPRLARDLSAELGKPVALELHGGDVELDRELVEMLRDPLTHIVRNAFDHGIEPPEARAAAAKPATGRLTIGARQAGNEIRITIVDDGAGIDTDALIQRAITVGAIESRTVVGFGAKQRLELIFAPGLSTAGSVTSVSGRGVGMDVVRANVERIGGSIEIESERGVGTTISLNIPLTLTIIPALTASVGGMRFAIPRSAIEEIVSLARDSARVERVGGAELAVVRGERLPLARLREVLELDGDRGEDGVLIIVQPTRRERYALAVSAVHDHEELVVKPAAPVVMAAGVYAGTALPDSGQPLLLLDAGGIARRAGLSFGAAAVEAEVHEDVASERASLLMFRDLDGMTRAVRLALVERIVEVEAARIAPAAGELRIAIDGVLIPVIASGPLPENGPVRLLRLGDGAREIGYAIAEIADVVAPEGAVEPARAPGRIAGAVLINDTPVEVIDPHFLFSEVAGGRSAGKRPLCLLRDEGDRWAREVLRPMIELAGYEVVAEADERAPDVVIDARASDAEPVAGGAPVVRLSEAQGGEGVYRYDRDGLLAALRAGAGGRKR